MADILSKIAAPAGANTAKTRAGRGVGSGLGKTAGRGQKGQKARSTGGMGRLRFQGGQTPMQRRLPKRGFRNPFRVEFAIVNLGQLESRFATGDVVDAAALHARGLLRSLRQPVKILADGELSKALTVKAEKFSAKAKTRLQAAGGSAEVVGRG